MKRSDWFNGLQFAEWAEQSGHSASDLVGWMLQRHPPSKHLEGAMDYVTYLTGVNCGYTGEIKYVRELTIVDEILEFAALLGSKGCNPTLCELSYENYQQLQASDYFTLAHDAYTKRDYFTAFGLEIRLIIGSNRHHCEVY